MPVHNMDECKPLLVHAVAVPKPEPKHITLCHSCMLEHHKLLGASEIALPRRLPEGGLLYCSMCLTHQNKLVAGHFEDWNDPLPLDSVEGLKDGAYERRIFDWAHDSLRAQLPAELHARLEPMPFEEL